VVIDYKAGYSMTVAPLVANGVLITGISGGEYGIRGFLDAGSRRRASTSGAATPPLERVAGCTTRDADPLAELEAGRVTAALIELDRWDAWRMAHPASPLRDSGYRSRIGFDMDFVALQGRGNLLRETDAALDALLHDGTVRTLAEQSGLTYVASRPPGITPPITPKLLAAED